MGKKGPLTIGYHVNPFGLKDGYLRLSKKTGWIESEASEKNKNCNSNKCKPACSQGTYQAGIKDTYGKSQTMMP